MTPLFKRSSSSGSYFFFLVCFSLLLMFLDCRDNQFVNRARVLLSISVQPLRSLANFPFDWMHRFQINLVSQEDLLVENQQLRQDKALLSVKFQKWTALQEENKRLQALLNTKPQIDGRVLGAKILSTNVFGNTAFVLNKGKTDNVFIGQMVLDEKGFVGQVIRVNWFESIVLPVTDSKSAIPVEVVRTGELAILAGTGSLERLVLNNLPKTSTIKKGDLLVTSRLGKNFQAGYPVGIAQQVRKTSSEIFTQVVVSPVAKVQKDRMVFLLWPNLKPHSHITSMPSKISVKTT